MRTPLPLLLAGGAVLLTTSPAALGQDTSSTKQECSNSLDFGVDVSYPIHTHHTIADNPLGDKQTFYDQLLAGCKDSCSDCGPECQQYEDDRISMNMRREFVIRKRGIWSMLHRASQKHDRIYSYLCP